MKYILLLLTLLTGSVLIAGAEPVLLRILDSTNQQALDRVSITLLLKQERISLLSNRQGECQIPEEYLPNKAIIHCIGYEPLRTTLSRSTNTIYLIPTSTDLQGVVITAQTKAIQQRESMYNIQTLTAKDLQDRGAITLNDALQFNVNQWVSQDNVLGSSVSLGGLSGQNIKILINGVPLNGRENGNIDLGQINLQHIKRVEIIQGPMSVLYGSNAMGGVINLITETGKNQQGASVQTYLESVGKINVGASAYKRFKQHQLSGSVARNFFDGWTDTDTGGRFQQWKPKTQYLGDLQYQWTPKEGTQLSYFASYLNETITNLGDPIINPFEGYAFDEYYRTQRLLQSINSENKIGKRGQFNTMNSYTTYQRLRNRYKKDLVNLSEFETAGTGDQDTSQFNTLNLRGIYTLRGKTKNEWQIGYDLNHETGRSFKLADTVQTLFEGAVFTSYTMHKKAWRIQPALRAIYNSRFAPALTPAIHGYYQISSAWLWRSSLAWGYRTPSMKELYLTFIDQNHTLLGNSQLKPEQGLRWESSIIHNARWGKKTAAFEGIVAYNRIHNMIFLAALPGNAILRQYANLDDYRNLSLQARAEINQKNYQIQSGFSVTHVLASKQFKAYNLYDFSVNGAYNFPRLRTRLLANYKLNSRQALLTIDNQFYFTRAIHLTGIALQHTFNKNHCTAQVGIKNLFNQINTPLNGMGNMASGHIAPSGMNIAPARSLYLDLRYHF